jgi:ATP-dependent Clp protease protease subunit
MSNLFSLRNITKPLAFKADASADGVLTLEIYDTVGADFFGEGITAKSISDAISTASDFKSITLRLNSPGGDLFEGVTIHNLIKASGKPVNVVVDGLAASAASLIAMAGDTCVMSDGSCMMIHRAMGLAGGYADDLRKTADILDTVTDSAADIYVSRTGVKKDEVLALMAAETWMTPKEAKDAGFATGTSTQKGKDVRNVFNLSVFKNTPESLQAKPNEVEPIEVSIDWQAQIDLMRKRLELAKRK